ncbi:MAG TPA: sigma-70 family RNA polymerase sigma factor [Thermoanaerobaculia bacterium]|nr:sigma-70 family RNA polymerase sigma factor [Thermoanaerobaculia bacterium]
MSPETPAPLDRSPLKDAELVRAMATGSQGALTELYDRHAPLVVGVAQRILGSREDAEEVAQEVFVHAWRQAASYQADRASVLTWLLLVTRSRAIDRLRSRRVDDRTRAAIESFGEEVHTSSGAFSNVLSEERGRRVREELDRLPAEQREVLEMAFFAGLTQSQIAAAAAIPLGTVKTRTLLAMKKLRAVLREQIRELL